ncbi:MAG: anaerobic ribonucleoside-triphosphate reductase activating protein [Bacteroidota bacterium]|nr:anaerobic ribonucleoside-triphosphate reductase activating protein [Bacteroidota bacterium]
MKIAGFDKQSLIDYPGNITSVIFTQGCNFRCGFCHNPELVLPEKFTKTFSENLILDYLAKHNKLLDAVCITGGEPTLHSDLPVFIEKIKLLNLKVKLDSNGTNYSMLMYLIKENLIDFIAMDIKHILEYEKYNKIVGNYLSLQQYTEILKSIKLIEKSNIQYEFRTTIIKNMHTLQHIKDLKNRFQKNYKLQKFNPEKVLNRNIVMESYSEKEFNNILV